MYAAGSVSCSHDPVTGFFVMAAVIPDRRIMGRYVCAIMTDEFLPFTLLAMICRTNAEFGFPGCAMVITKQCRLLGTGALYGCALARLTATNIVTLHICSLDRSKSACGRFTIGGWQPRLVKLCRFAGNCASLG